MVTSTVQIKIIDTLVGEDDENLLDTVGVDISFNFKHGEKHFGSFR